jgi:maltose alpha-D-glucosyltransferase / alpha-amylase
MGLGAWQGLFTGQGRLELENVILPRFLTNCRWFGGKGRSISSVNIQDLIPSPDDSEWSVLFLDVSYTEGPAETYFLPLAMAYGQEGIDLEFQAPSAIVNSWIFEKPNETVTSVLYDAVYHSGFRAHLIKLVSTGGTWSSPLGTLTGQARVGAFVNFQNVEEHVSHVLKVEQSNTALVYPGRFFFKLIRRLEMGENPELEILRFLNEKTTFRNSPSFEAALVYTNSSQASISVGIVEGLVAHQQGAWEYSLGLARGFLTGLLKSSLQQVEMEPALVFARLLGKRTAELHLALASGSQDHGFSPEPFSLAYQVSLSKNMRAQAHRIFADLDKKQHQLPLEIREMAPRILALLSSVLEAYSGLEEHIIPTHRIRVHGDYHLGQVLFTGQDVCILDFEGEPMRSLSERKQKLSPWKDVAGMIRSFHYAIHSARPDTNDFSYLERERLGQATEAWLESMTKEFLQVYLASAGATVFIPSEPDRRILLRAYLMEKAIYELDYELNNRPDWAHIPMSGILNLCRLSS